MWLVVTIGVVLMWLGVAVLYWSAAQSARRAALGRCPRCRLPLSVANMHDGSVCLDERFYCDECKKAARCGC